MTELRQREPRQREPKYLAWLRTKGCCCGCRSAPPSDAAHLRAGSILADKRPTGLAEKPHDRWALPLRHDHHMAQHAFGDELLWFAMHGIIDPWRKCRQFYAAYVLEMVEEGMGKLSIRKPLKAKPAKKRTTGLGWPKKSRKIINRGFSKRSKP